MNLWKDLALSARPAAKKPSTELEVVNIKEKLLKPQIFGAIQRKRFMVSIWDFYIKFIIWECAVVVSQGIGCFPIWLVVLYLDPSLYARLKAKGLYYAHYKTQAVCHKRFKTHRGGLVPGTRPYRYFCEIFLCSLIVVVGKNISLFTYTPYIQSVKCIYWCPISSII